MRGEQQDGKPLDSAYPLTAFWVWITRRKKWGCWYQAALVEKTQPRQQRHCFQAPGYGVWDVGAWYKPFKNLEIGANIYNVGNKKYWQHADVAGMSRTRCDGLVH